MTQMIEVKTADLIGLALEYATGVADGRELELPGAFRGRTTVVWCDPFVIQREGRPVFHDKTRRKWQPSTDWSNGGPLIASHQVNLHSPQTSDDCWAAWVTIRGKDFCQGGWQPLVAACRAIVAAKLGDVVSVPAELV